MFCTQFDTQKESSLSRIDLSRKGSVDLPIRMLVECINKQQHYFTTSSCSGRILVFENDECNPVKKKGCHWLFTSHDCIEASQLATSLDAVRGDAVFKFEPLILHVQCRSLEDAQKLHSVAIASGLRNSGISVGGKGKIIAAIRSTHMLEVPLSCKGEILVSKQYIDFLVDCANNKMKENSNRIDRFFQNFIKMTESSASQKETQLISSGVEINKYSKSSRQKPSNIQSENKQLVNTNNSNVADSSCISVDSVEDTIFTVHSDHSKQTDLDKSSSAGVNCVEDVVAQCFFLSNDT